MAWGQLTRVPGDLFSGPLLVDVWEWDFSPTVWGQLFPVRVQADAALCRRSDRPLPKPSALRQSGSEELDPRVFACGRADCRDGWRF